MTAKMKERRKIGAAALVLGGLTAAGVMTQGAIVRADSCCTYNSSLDICIGSCICTCPDPVNGQCASCCG